MAIKVLIPAPLQKITGGKTEAMCEGSNVKEVIGNLEALYPEISGRIRDESGQLRRFINVYVNEEDIRFMDGEDTETKDGDEVSIIPAIAGG